MKNSPRNVSMNLDTKERDLMSVKKLPKDGSPRPSHTDADSSLLVISELLQAHKRLRQAKEIEQRVQNHEKTKIEKLLNYIGMKSKKYHYVYNGVKFVSDKEIIGINPNTYKLIYKNEK